MGGVGAAKEARWAPDGSVHAIQTALMTICQAGPRAWQNEHRVGITDGGTI